MSDNHHGNLNGWYCCIARIADGNEYTMNNKRTSSIHKIRELNLETLYIDRDYDVLKEIGSGDYGKVILAVHRDTGSEVRPDQCSRVLNLTAFTQP